MQSGAKKHQLCERDPELHVGTTDSVEAFVYILPCRGEDILKVGFSRDPLVRMRTLHARFFEYFDLERALLVGTESVADARTLEAELFAAADVHRAPAPLQVAVGAGGHTEWFRGAYFVVREAAIRRASACGYAVHAPMGTWTRRRMRLEEGYLYESASHLMRAIDSAYAYATRDAAAESSLCNLIDSFVSVGIDVVPRIPTAALNWYSGRRH